VSIYLVQHGKPVPKEENPDRPLSDQGKRDVEEVAVFLAKGNIKPEKILHSGKTRARETAQILASVLHPLQDPLEKDGLAPMDDVRMVAEEIKKDTTDTMIVGHLPHLDRLTSLLTMENESRSLVGFQQGGVVCLSPEGEAKTWKIAWMVVPDLIKP